MFHLTHALPRPIDEADYGPRPEPFPAGTPIGMHLRVDRLVRVSHNRVYYLVNDRDPRWYTRKCWFCGNKHSPAGSATCSYCTKPLKPRRFFMSARWNPQSCSAFEAYAHRRIDAPGVLQPLAIYRYHEQLLTVYPWHRETLLLGEAMPLPSADLLRGAFQLADALAHLHAFGVVLRRLEAGHVLLHQDGGLKLFDLEVERMEAQSIYPSEDFTQPPLRDLRDLCELLGAWCPVEDEELRLFLRAGRRGQWPTADLLAGAANTFARQRMARPVVASMAAGQTDPGLVRSLNEDSSQWRRVAHNAWLAVVADGMGGHLSGEVASQLATRTFSRAVQRLQGDRPTLIAEQAGPLLAEATRAANQAVCTLASERRAHMGTTLVATLLVAEAERFLLYVVHVGDSRLYLLRDGALRRLTEDHSMVAAMVAAGKLTEAEARHHPRSNVLLSFLGAGLDIEPELAAFEVAPGDRILLCSDGLWGEVQDDEIERLLGLDLEPRRSVTRLVRAANDAGGGDNITAIVLDVPWPGGAEAEEAPTPELTAGSVEPAALEDPPTVSSLTQPAASALEAEDDPSGEP